jgi:hypothetical protein
VDQDHRPEGGPVGGAEHPVLHRAVAVLGSFRHDAERYRGGAPAPERRPSDQDGSAACSAASTFLRANPLIARVLDAEGDARIGDPLARFADRIAALVPASPERVLLVRMAILGINAAVEAAVGTDVDDADVIAAARAAARALVAEAQRPVA